MGKLVRLLENDRNLAVRAMHIVMFGGKRSSSAERQHKVEEYETALADGRGEDILTDLEEYKSSQPYLPAALEEDIAEVTKLVKIRIREVSEEMEISEMEEEIRIFKTVDEFVNWFDESTGREEIIKAVRNISPYLRKLYEGNERLAKQETEREFQIGIVDRNEQITWFENLTDFMVELKKRLALPEEKDFQMSYETIREFEKEMEVEYRRKEQAVGEEGKTR